ncbi:MAG: sigma-70 family RNA polymerase sigma factor [Clostridiales bacterium]|uniref:sigma-70 family RNA polymerase sigma factor n=1 Tax=Clostridium sp. TaxID=1506 RepID=UPI0029096420|nr:sigma-70 family RNA polymerase sigma factor [Clostridium sp.]MDU6274032.1 sigma-70 family RNA polymerase sigma factor [Clostridium sp.]MDU6360833.1 sigma-70 family RNA polymerase sigma factor [Clostridiales bacterium]
MTNEELIQSYKQGKSESLQLLLEQNKALIYKVAKRFFIGHDNAIDQEDLIQEGYIGLIKAVEKYNEDTEAGFITYAYYWIYQAMHRFMYPTRNKINNKSMKVNSLNAMVSGLDDDIELQETLADEDIYPDIEENIANKEDYKHIEQILTNGKNINPNVLQVVRLKYGFSDGKCYTYEEIGTILGVTGTYVKQIQENAFREIRKSKWARMRVIEQGYMRKGKAYDSGSIRWDFMRELLNLAI